jgi:hypothetical protein
VTYHIRCHQRIKAVLLSHDEELERRSQKQEVRRTTVPMGGLSLRDIGEDQLSFSA